LTRIKGKNYFNFYEKKVFLVDPFFILDLAKFFISSEAFYAKARKGKKIT